MPTVENHCTRSVNINLLKKQKVIEVSIINNNSYHLLSAYSMLRTTRTPKSYIRKIQLLSSFFQKKKQTNRHSNLPMVLQTINGEAKM